MTKKIVLFMMAALIFIYPVIADDTRTLPAYEEMTKVLDVITDCFSTTIASIYSSYPVVLPSCSVSMDTQSNLPARVSYFLADPYQFQASLKNASAIQGNLINTIIALLQNQEKDPLISASYMNLVSKNYQQSQFYLSGYIIFGYPGNTTLENLSSLLLSREYSGSSVELNLSLNVIQANRPPISVSGIFEMTLKEDGKISVSPLNSYLLNGNRVEGGSYTF